jgi:hypothetical protein
VITAAQMEEVLRNFDRRLANVEQILPSLATKEDLMSYPTRQDLKEELKAFATKQELRSEIEIVRTEMKQLFSEARRHASVLFEKTQEQLELIAAYVADISQRLPPRR